MKTTSRNFNSAPFFLTFVAAFLFFAAVRFSPAGDLLDTHVARRAEFAFRVWSGKEPEINSRLKILAFDDTAFQTLGPAAISDLSNWTMLLKAVAQQRPAKVLIDSFFSHPVGTQETLQSFIETLNQAKLPIISGAFVSETPLVAREELTNTLIPQYRTLTSLPQIPAAERHVYGPARSISAAFTNVGHFVVLDDGRMKPAYIWDDSKFLPLLGLLAADRVNVEEKAVVADDKIVYLDHLNRLQVNLVSRKKFWEKSIGMLSIFQDAQQGRPISAIGPGDIVLILPSMFTGNTDFKSSPLGKIEGGLLHAAVVNSALNGQWLRPIGDSAMASVVAILIASVLGTACAHSLRSRLAIFVILSGMGCAVAVALWEFAHNGVIVYWLLPTVTFGTAGFLGLGARAFQLEKHSQRVATALEGLVSPVLLRKLMLDPTSLRIEPKEVQATVMFIDVEGFSLRAEIRKPTQVFLELREQLARITKIIHKHGGIVDKTLGDGLLCFFGYSYGDEGVHKTDGHALAALTCAVEIQRECAQLAIASLDQTVSAGTRPGAADSILPLRIGINSGPIYFGNLGTALRIDFTIVGDTVNFAKRLEDSSEIFRVMIGTQTRDLLHRIPRVPETDPEGWLLPLGTSLQRRLLNIKHHHELIEGWECDPFASEPETFHRALNAARERISRNSQRWHIPAQVEIPVFVNRSQKALMRNFSLSGICFEGAYYLARKVQVTVDIDVPGSPLRLSCENAGLTPLVTQVRWGNTSDGQVRHGVQIMNLNSEQRETLVGLLLDHVAATCDKKQPIGAKHAEKEQ